MGKEKKKPKVEQVKKVYINNLVSYNNKLVPKEQFEKYELYYKAHPRDYFVRNKLTVRYWIDRRKAKKQPHKVVLVRMELNNKKIREFLVPQTESFVYNGARYIFDHKSIYQNLDAGGIWCYDFHESLCLPIKKDVKFTSEIEKLVTSINSTASKQLAKPVDKSIDVNEIKDSIEASGVIETETSINPSVLQRLIESEIAQGVLRGATMGTVMKVILILLIIIVLIVAIDTIVDVTSSGLLEELNVKGGGDE